MSEKERIDLLIVQKGLIETREKARAVIMAGQVYINTQKIDKPGTKVDKNSDIEIREGLKYVSRGGLKLEKAINTFNICLDNKVCIDIGASTGGFTDCMLQNGAKKVFAVDVGYGQLAWKLRQDKRVVTMEKTNIRYVKQSDIGEIADFASIDVSFISLTKVITVVKDLLSDCGQMICLIKPQFEAGREKVGKKGVVRDPQIHSEVIENIIEFADTAGFFLKGLTFSPIKGPEGNIEYLAYFSKEGKKVDSEIESIIQNVVKDSHNELND